MEDLASIPTCKLVEELAQRRGVEFHQVDPYEPFELACTGPVVILVVED